MFSKNPGRINRWHRGPLLSNKHGLVSPPPDTNMTRWVYINRPWKPVSTRTPWWRSNCERTTVGLEHRCGSASRAGPRSRWSPTRHCAGSVPSVVWTMCLVQNPDSNDGNGNGAKLWSGLLLEPHRGDGILVRVGSRRFGYPKKYLYEELPNGKRQKKTTQHDAPVGKKTRRREIEG